MTKSDNGCDSRSRARQKKLSLLMHKQTVSVAFACSTSAAFLIVGAIYPPLSYQVPSDAIMNTIAVWLMFSFATPAWNCCVKYCCKCVCCGCYCCTANKEQLMQNLNKRISVLRSKPACCCCGAVVLCLCVCLCREEHPANIEQKTADMLHTKKAAGTETEENCNDKPTVDEGDKHIAQVRETAIVYNDTVIEMQNSNENEPYTIAEPQSAPVAQDFHSMVHAKLPPVAHSHSSHFRIQRVHHHREVDASTPILEDVDDCAAAPNYAYTMVNINRQQTMNKFRR